MIIDTHIHIFVDALAPRVLEQLASTANIPYYADLTEKDTREKLRSWGVDLGVAMPIATKPHQQKTINDWASTLQKDNLLSFGTVHPDAPDALEELDRVAGLGLKGIKLHPDYQHFHAGDEKAYPIYSKAQDLDLPILFHAGFDPVSPDDIHCTPKELRQIADDFPSLHIIGAHMGGNMLYDDVETYLVGQDIYIDISMAPLYCSFEQFTRIIQNHDPNKVLFASDCPWSSPLAEIEWVRNLPITDEHKEKHILEKCCSAAQYFPKSGINALLAHPCSCTNRFLSPRLSA